MSSLTRHNRDLVLVAALLASGLLAMGGSGCVTRTAASCGDSTVALVRAQVPVEDNNPDSKLRLQYFSIAADALRRAGVPFRTVSDRDVSGGALDGFAVAVFPYVFEWSRDLEAATLRFLRDGGKVIACYRIPASVAHALGVRLEGCAKDSATHPFDSCALTGDPLRGAPTSFVQHSWHVMLAQPSGRDARTLYEWRDARGNGTGRAAVILSPRGAYIGHVLTKTDREAKAALLISLLGHFCPDLWPRCAYRALTDVGRVGTAQSLGDLRSLVEQAAEEGRAKGALDFLDEVDALVDRARDDISHGRYDRAISRAMRAHKLASYAYVRGLPTRDCELRGLWVNNPRGIKGNGWEWTARLLARMGFNAVFVNMGSAVQANYPSALLPTAPGAQGRDLLAECLQACRENGLECHAWRFVFFAGNPPPETLARLRDEGRLQVDRSGRVLPWLCPSDPRNIELERAVLLELASRYDLQGIHLDYVRFPNADTCFCPRCRRAFESAVGRPYRWWPEQLVNGPEYERFQRWRQDVVSGFVKQVSQELHARKPLLEVSAAVVPTLKIEGYLVAQQWDRWVQEDWLNFVCPMDYGESAENIGGLVTQQLQATGGGIPLYAGLGSWLLQDVTDLAEQIRATRESGADGYVLFHGDDLTLAEDWLPQLRSGPTTINAVAPHVGPWSGLAYPAGTRPQAAGAELVARRDQPFTIAGWVAPDSGIRSARLALAYLDGKQVGRSYRLYPGRRREVSFSPPPGTYRPVITGQWGQRPFERRGRIIRVLSPGEE